MQRLKRYSSLALRESYKACLIIVLLMYLSYAALLVVFVVGKER
jgi:hypothetical protein